MRSWFCVPGKGMSKNVVTWRDLGPGTCGSRSPRTGPGATALHAHERSRRAPFGGRSQGGLVTIRFLLPRERVPGRWPEFTRLASGRRDGRTARRLRAGVRGRGQTGARRQVILRTPAPVSGLSPGGWKGRFGRREGNLDAPSCWLQRDSSTGRPGPCRPTKGISRAHTGKSNKIAPRLDGVFPEDFG